jgi:adenosylmethionine-8-amino-7-oxononanoate aminotransferase
VVQVAPPLISSAEQLDEMVDSLGEVLSDAGELMELVAKTPEGAA